MRLTRSTWEKRDQYGPEFTLVSDWLATNGIDELIPENPVIEVNNTEQHIIYRAFQFIDGRRGYDLSALKTGYTDILIEDRTVPLIVPLTVEVRDAFQYLEDHGGDVHATLVERTGPTAWSTRRDGYADDTNRILAQNHTGS